MDVAIIKLTKTKKYFFHVKIIKAGPIPPDFLSTSSTIPVVQPESFF
jgi:hypothetical protein